MNRKQKIKLTSILGIVFFLGVAVMLILYALKQNINLFYTPTEVLRAQIQPNQIVRIGGYVKSHSVHYDNTGRGVTFTITDKTHDIAVTYHGVLPNLFREGQGIVVTGKLSETHELDANQVLAKHDEKYMPWPLTKELNKGTQKT